MWLEVVREASETLVRKTHRGHVFLQRVGAGGNAVPMMEHLDCFAPGMLMLGADVLEKDLAGGGSRGSMIPPPAVSHSELTDLRELAKNVAHTCYDMYKMSQSGLAPEWVAFLEQPPSSEASFAEEHLGSPSKFDDMRYV